MRMHRRNNFAPDLDVRLGRRRDGMRRGRGAALQAANHRGQFGDPRLDRLELGQWRRRLPEHQRETNQYRGPDCDR